MRMAGQKSPAFWVYHQLWRLLDWLFPPLCGGCGALGARWCADCQQQVTRVTGPVCPVCGEMAVGFANPGTACPKCQAALPAFTALRSFGLYQGPLRRAILRMKYKGDMGLGEPLSNHLAALYNELNWDIDLVVPVPLSTQRRRERGYNQSGLLGRPLAYAIKKDYQPGVLMRTRETRSQVGLSASERRQNVQGAFQARPALVGGKTILLIDDVTTTGSTISACAQALRQAGASAVFGLTLARALSPEADMRADADDQPKPSHMNRR